MCYNPVHTHDGKTFPCGHCLACLKAYQDAWTARLTEEVKAWKPVPVAGASRPVLPVVFFTLKFRNDTIPCNYLVCTDCGYYITDKKPDCKIYPFWTQLSEDGNAWTKRKSDYLKMYHDWWKETAKTVASKGYDDGYPESSDLTYEDVLDAFLQHDDCTYESDYFQHLEHVPDEVPYIVPSFNSKAKPVFAFEFHTVDKDCVQRWLKRGRINLVRNLPSIFDNPDKCNPRFNPYWSDSDGVRHQLPSCAIPATLKYFITSEYGPRTYRPHFHGVIFGLTFDEFKEFFAQDWIDNYGTIEYSVYNPSRGGMLYISKYCSKGGYEHPYCSKDFFYPSGKEFHSKHYEACVRDFNLDRPLVMPTFHLISNGIGVTYCFNSNLLSYFGARLIPYTTPSGRVNYRVTDSDTAPIVVPSIGLEEALGDSRVLEVEETLFGYRIRKYAYGKTPLEKGDLLGESILPYDAVVNFAFEASQYNKKYNRTYVTQKSKTKLSDYWHLLQNSGDTPQVRITSIPLPRYYRRWLVSPLSSALRTSVATILHPNLDAEITRELQSERPDYSRVSALRSQLDSREACNKDTQVRLRKCAQNFYSQSEL